MSLQVYYCKQSESPGSTHRIAPAPSISISPEIYYANDNVIGYTYNITLNGYANALRKEKDSGSTTTGLGPTIDHMGDIREIFNTNGGNLYIKQGSSNVLVAKGATIKSINFNESDNRWVNYAPFSIELEFNEVDFIGCDNNTTIGCDTSIFHQINNAKIISDNLVDIKAYKIKEFSDKWTFTIDNQIYDNWNGVFNNLFKVNYTISATGKNYYKNDKLVPAWQQARLFVQDRLYKQVLSLIGGHLQIESDNNSACDATKDIAQIHNSDNTNPRSDGLFEGFDTGKDSSAIYEIYNEKISCDTSESDGTFSVTYESIVKKYDSTITNLQNAVLHTFTKNLTHTNDQSSNSTMTVQGTIQGLVRGGFLYYNNNFTLPQNGTFLTAVNSNETKYTNALSYYQTIVGNNTDLTDTFKEKLNIKKSQLLIKGTDGYPVSSSFTLDHDYKEGSIGYNATYEKSLASVYDRGFTNISITRQDPTDIIQEFVIPGRAAGPIIQKLNMKTARTISVNIEGASASNKSCDISTICNNIPSFNINNFQQLLDTNNNWIKTKEDYNVNRLDGSFTISLEYTTRVC